MRGSALVLLFHVATAVVANVIRNRQTELNVNPAVIALSAKEVDTSGVAATSTRVMRPTQKATILVNGDIDMGAWHTEGKRGGPLTHVSATMHAAEQVVAAGRTAFGSVGVMNIQHPKLDVNPVDIAANSNGDEEDMDGQVDKELRTQSGAHQPQHYEHYIMHIPKTAGTSFEQDASKLVKLEFDGRGWNEIDFCQSSTKNDGNIKLLTMLRDPRAHVLSMYHHCKDSPTHHATTHGVDYLPDSFEKWINQWFDTRSSANVHNAQKQKTLAEATCCYNPSNLMTTRIMCLANATHDMHIAKARIESLWFVGITEFYEASMCLLTEKITGTLPEGCTCGEEMDVSHNDWGTKPHDIKDESAEAISKIDAITREDRILYKAGLHRFLAEVKEVEARHNVDILCDQRKKRDLFRRETSGDKVMGCDYKDNVWNGTS